MKYFHCSAYGLYGHIPESSYEEFFSDVFLERWVVFITSLFFPNSYDGRPIYSRANILQQHLRKGVRGYIFLLFVHIHFARQIARKAHWFCTFLYPCYSVLISNMYLSFIFFLFFFFLF